MADKRIIDFAVLDDAKDDDVLLVSSDSQTYCITVGALKSTLKSYADDIMLAVSNSLTYKGFVDYRKDLPSTGNMLGDTYTVRYQAESEESKVLIDGTNYVWSAKGNTASWLSLSPSINQKMDKLSNSTYGNIAVVGDGGNVTDSGTALSKMLSANEVGVANGIASLDAKGKIPRTQLPMLGLQPQVIVTADIGCFVTCTCGAIELSAQSQNGKVTFSLPDYGTWTVGGSQLDKQAAPVTLTVDTVKQYRAKISFFAAYLTVTGASPGAQLFVGNNTISYSAQVSGESPTIVRITIAAPGTYSIWETTEDRSRLLGTVDIENDGQNYEFEVVNAGGKV